MNDVLVILRNVDWVALRRQKETLVGLVNVSNVPPNAAEVDDLEGVLGLLDHIQDQAAKVLGEECVFGKLSH